MLINSMIVETLVKSWIASMLLGEAPSYKIHGTKEQITVLVEALMATWQLNKEVNESCSVQTISESLHRKHYSVCKFEKLFKMSWPV